MLRNAGESCSISRTRARFPAELSPHSSVSEPPSPPAPFTFHPSAPCSFAIATTLRASVPTRAEWSRPCASVLSTMARPRASKSPAERASRERGAVRRSSTMAGEAGPVLSAGSAAALAMEHLRLDPLGGGGHLVGGEPPGGEGVESADEGDGDRGGRAGACARRRLRVDRDLEAQVLRHFHVRDGRLEERVGGPGR